VLIILDEVKLRKARHLELRFHPEHDDVEREDKDWLIHGPKAHLRIACLTPSQSTISAEHMVGIREEANNSMFTLRIRSKRKEWRNAVGISWSKVDEMPKKITLKQDGTIWRFDTGLGCLSFDWETGTAQWL
jgi:hypothetical protein